MNHVPRIVVVGSINMDLVVRCAILPTPGETILAQSSTEVPGGKGANQAVSAARLGARVWMIGRIGDDSFASRLHSGLVANGVDCSAVLRTESSASGIAIIGVQDNGQNQITVIPNANALLTPSDIDRFETVIKDASMLLLQLEIPMPTVVRAAAIARAHNVPILLDPAPAPHELPAELFSVDVMCPNQTEAAAILGRSVVTIDDAKLAARELFSRGVRIAIITLGADGVVVCSDEGCKLYNAPTIKAVDSTAAGDAFAAAFSVCQSNAESLDQKIRFACAAGAVAASRHGAQPSLPTRLDVESLLQRTVS